jgi:hypothetical protein
MLSDVNLDGRLDLTARFVMSTLRARADTSKAALTGSIGDGQLFVATGTISIEKQAPGLATDRCLVDPSDTAGLCRR